MFYICLHVAKGIPITGDKIDRYLPIWRHRNVVAMSYHRNNPESTMCSRPISLSIARTRLETGKSCRRRLERRSRWSRGLSNDWTGTRMASYCLVAAFATIETGGRPKRWVVAVLMHIRIYTHIRVLHTYNIRFRQCRHIRRLSLATDNASMFVQVRACRICLVPFINPFRVPSKFHP